MAGNKMGGVFTMQRRVIPVKRGKPIHIIPFGDIHRDSPLCDVAGWREHINWGKGRDDCYYLGMGDYLDFASSSEREILSRGLHDTTEDLLSDIAKKHSDDFVKEISWMGDRLLGLIEGNHHGLVQRNLTTTEYMCQRMNAPYLGCMCIMRLVLEMGTCHKNYDICAYHGKGAARLLGSSINAVQYMAEGVDADLYMMGHDHKRGCVPGARIGIDYDNKNGELVLRERDMHFCRTGSFLKSYEHGKRSYIADKGGGPISLGGIRIAITPQRPLVNGRLSFRAKVEVTV